MNESIRIDKWLWAARIFKTRNLAAEACKGGKVKIDQQSVKASREVRTGDVVDVLVNQLHKKVEVKDPIKNRVSAKMIDDVYIDRTPQEELERYEMLKASKAEYRGRGLGRPTKKERRMIDKLKNE